MLMSKEEDKKFIAKPIVLLLIACIILAGTITALVLAHSASNSNNPVPKDIRQMVSFPVYYPDAKKMPPNYRLDPQSFSASSQGVVVYSIRYQGIKKVAVSEQRIPSKGDIEYFYTHDLPLHTTLNTSVGIATIGAIGQQSVTSLLANKNTWLIITAPATIDKTQLAQLLESMTQSND